jgi:hypothetical protein
MSAIVINIPIEIDAGEFATSMAVQGETVSYNKVHVPLQYETTSGDPTVADMRDTFQWKEGTDQTEVNVIVTTSGVASYANGKAAVKALFKNALKGSDLRNVGLASGVVYADHTSASPKPRNTTTSGSPVKFYVDKDTHVLGTTSGAALKAYLEEYLYDNLSAAIGLAATTGVISLGDFKQGESEAAEYIAEKLATQICGLVDASGNPLNTEQGVAAAALRQNIYEQMFTLAPSRFAESSLVRSDTANDAAYKDLPFVVGDTMAFLVTFKFPANKISAPVVQNSIRTGESSVYVDTGSKIAVSAPASATNPAPTLSSFPDCTVMLRAKLTA